MGYLPQEPELEAGKTVGEEIEKAVSEIRGLLKEYEEVRALMAATHASRLKPRPE